ncbi:hypothetical protein ACFL4W_00050 [Planctomycetota bacterium]
MKTINLILVCLMIAGAVTAGTVKVSDVKDTLVLTDGSEVKGTVVVAGDRMVCIVIADKEIEYETELVQEIKYGKVVEEVTTYVTAQVDGQEKIVARGTDTTPAPAPRKAVTAPQPEAAPKPKAQPAPRKNVPFNYPKVKGGGDAAKNIQNLLKNPAVANQIRNMNKTGQLDKYLQQNKIPLNASQVMQMLNQMSK